MSYHSGRGESDDAKWGKHPDFETQGSHQIPKIGLPVALQMGLMSSKN